MSSVYKIEADMGKGKSNREYRLFDYVKTLFLLDMFSSNRKLDEDLAGFFFVFCKENFLYLVKKIPHSNGRSCLALC